MSVATLVDVPPLSLPLLQHTTPHEYIDIYDNHEGDSDDDDLEGGNSEAYPLRSLGRHHNDHHDNDDNESHESVYFSNNEHEYESDDSDIERRAGAIPLPPSLTPSSRPSFAFTPVSRRSVEEAGASHMKRAARGAGADANGESASASALDVDASLNGAASAIARDGAGDSKRKNKKKNKGAEANGHGHTQESPRMSSLEHRRRHSALDGTAQSQTAHLMSMSSFSLDQEPPPLAEDGKLSTSDAGFWDLAPQERRNFLMLVLLYFLQGIPLGLAGGSVPFLLKSFVSYGQIGVFSLAAYPYSLKLLWSPIVDAVWSPRVGRRKSWILPVQTVSGIGLIWLGSRVDGMMKASGEGDGSGIWNFTFWWFMLVLTCATQDIAVDGWALTLLSQKNLAYASTAQTVGLTGGQFLSYTVFLAFHSPDFANKWFRTTPQEVGLLTLGGYTAFWGWMYLLVTIGLGVLKTEEKTKERDGILQVYRSMWGVLKLRNIQAIVVVHLIAKIGFQANDAVTNLKLLDKGFSQEDLALTVLIDFPFELSLGYYVGKWSSQYPPMQLWCWAFVGRLFAAVFAQSTVAAFPVGGTTTGFLLLVIVVHIFSTFMSTVMFVAASAFHAKIADPLIGGTYMTLLATVSNLGGTFPRFFVLKLVDVMTAANCVPPTKPPVDILDPITSSFSCVLEPDKQRCITGGGVCRIDRDGYYIANIACIIFGTITFWSYIRPRVLALQALPLRAWRVMDPADRHVAAS